MPENNCSVLWGTTQCCHQHCPLCLGSFINFVPLSHGKSGKSSATSAPHYYWTVCSLFVTTNWWLWTCKESCMQVHRPTSVLHVQKYRSLAPEILAEWPEVAILRQKMLEILVTFPPICKSFVLFAEVLATFLPKFWFWHFLGTFRLLLEEQSGSSGS